MEILQGHNQNKITDEITYAAHFDFGLLWEQHTRGDMIPWFQDQYLALEDKQMLRRLIVRCADGGLPPGARTSGVAFCVSGGLLEGLDEVYNPDAPVAAADCLSEDGRLLRERVLEFLRQNASAPEILCAWERRMDWFAQVYEGMRAIGEDRPLEQTALIWAMYAFAGKEPDDADVILGVLGKSRSQKHFTHAPETVADTVRAGDACDTQAAFTALLGDDTVSDIILLPSNLPYRLPLFEGTNRPVHIVTRRISARTTKTYGKVCLDVVNAAGETLCSWSLDDGESLFANTLGGALLHKLPDLSLNSSLCLYRRPGGQQELWYYDLRTCEKYRMRELTDFTFFCVGSDRTVAVINRAGRIDIFSDYGIDYSTLHSVGGRRAVYACLHGTRYLVLFDDGAVRSNVYGVEESWQGLVGIALTGSELAVGIRADGSVISNDIDGRLDTRPQRDVWQVALWEDRLSAISRAGQMQGFGRQMPGPAKVQQVCIDAKGCVALDGQGNLLTDGRKLTAGGKLREIALCSEGTAQAWVRADGGKRIFAEHAGVIETLD